MEEYESIMFYPKVGEINVHAQTVYTRPSPPPILEGLGTKLEWAEKTVLSPCGASILGLTQAVIGREL